MPIFISRTDLGPAWRRYVDRRIRVPEAEQLPTQQWIGFCKERVFADHHITLHIRTVNEQIEVDDLEFESEAAVTAFMIANL